MLEFLLYIIVGSIFATTFSRYKDWKSWDKDGRAVACVAVGAIWPVSLPITLFSVLTHKVLDKYTKV